MKNRRFTSIVSAERGSRCIYVQIARDRGKETDIPHKISLCTLFSLDLRPASFEKLGLRRFVKKRSLLGVLACVFVGVPACVLIVCFLGCVLRFRFLCVFLCGFLCGFLCFNGFPFAVFEKSSFVSSCVFSCVCFSCVLLCVFLVFEWISVCRL